MDSLNGKAHPRYDQMFPVLEARDIEGLRHFGSDASFPAGTIIVRAGELSPGLIVVLSGKIEILEAQAFERREVVVTHRAGEFHEIFIDLGDRTTPQRGPVPKFH